MKERVRLAVSLLLMSWVGLNRLAAQPLVTDTVAAPTSKRSTHLPPPQDMVDVARRWYPRLPLAAHDSATLHEGKHFVLVIPQVGYTLQTRGLVGVLVNAAFRKPQANMSSTNMMVSYTQNNQLILTANSAIWLPDNRFLWTNDWRLMHYPQATYGLGMYTTTDRVISMDYSYLRLYQGLLRQLASNLYAGVGYNLDLHWNIESYIRNRELDPDFAVRLRCSGPVSFVGAIAASAL